MLTKPFELKTIGRGVWFVDSLRIFKKKISDARGKDIDPDDRPKGDLLFFSTDLRTDLVYRPGRLYQLTENTPLGDHIVRSIDITTHVVDFRVCNAEIA